MTGVRALADRVLARNRERLADLVPLFQPLGSGTAEQSSESGRNLPKTRVPRDETKWPLWNRPEQARRAFGPTADRPADWSSWMDRRVARRLGFGDTDVQARHHAFGDALSEWHTRHGARAAPGRCAGCGRGIDGNAVFALPHGAAVHGDGLGCLIAYGERWRADAVVGLKALSIEAPVGWTP